MFWKKENSYTFINNPYGEIDPPSFDLYEKYYRKNPIVNKAINLVSLSASRFKIIGKTKEARNFIQSPCGEFPWNFFIRKLLKNLYIYGNIFFKKEGNLLKDVNLRKIKIIHDEEKTLSYKFSDPKIGEKKYQKNEIFHLKLAADQIYGISPMEPAQISIEIDLAISLYILGIIQNGGKSAGILSVPSKYSLTDKEELYGQLRNLYKKLGNTNNAAIVEGKIEWQKIGESPKDLELLQKKSRAEIEIAAAFNIPPLLLGISLENATYTNYQTALDHFYENIEYPLLKSIVEQISFFLYNDSSMFEVLDLETTKKRQNEIL